MYLLMEPLFILIMLIPGKKIPKILTQRRQYLITFFPFDKILNRAFWNIN